MVGVKRISPTTHKIQLNSPKEQIVILNFWHDLSMCVFNPGGCVLSAWGVFSSLKRTSGWNSGWPQMEQTMEHRRWLRSTYPKPESNMHFLGRCVAYALVLTRLVLWKFKIELLLEPHIRSLINLHVNSQLIALFLNSSKENCAFHLLEDLLIFTRTLLVDFII